MSILRVKTSQTLRDLKSNNETRQKSKVQDVARWVRARRRMKKNPDQTNEGHDVSHRRGGVTAGNYHCWNEAHSTMS